MNRNTQLCVAFPFFLSFRFFLMNQIVLMLLMMNVVFTLFRKRNGPKPLFSPQNATRRNFAIFSDGKNANLSYDISVKVSMQNSRCTNIICNGFVTRILNQVTDFFPLWRVCVCMVMFVLKFADIIWSAIQFGQVMNGVAVVDACVPIKIRSIISTCVPLNCIYKLDQRMSGIKSWIEHLKWLRWPFMCWLAGTKRHLNNKLVHDKLGLAHFVWSFNEINGAARSRRQIWLRSSN